MSHKTRNAERIIAMLLSLVMLMGLLPMSVFAADVQGAQISTQAQEPAFAFGTKGTLLAPGKYDLPVELMNASKPKPSMAAAAILGAELEVLEDGTAFVSLNLGPVEAMGQTGWSKDWAVYQEYSTDSEKVPAQVTATNETGNPAAIRFQLPFTDQDGVYVNMAITVAPMKPDALLEMDFAALAQSETPDPQPEPEPQPEVKTGMADVSFGAEKAYEVTAQVSVLEGKIVGVELNHNAAEAGHANSVQYADKAKAMAEGFRDLSAADKSAIEGVDTITGATITSNSYKTAVLKALDLYVPPKAPDFTFGSADTPLEAGTYTVPVALMNASKHENPSMAASAFAPVATLTVAEDGTAVMTMDMAAVTIGMGNTQITDMAYDVKIYQGNDLSSATVDAAVLETVQKPEPMPGAGKDVPTRISFTVPNNDFDGVYVQFTVDAMGPGYPDGWLKIDYSGAVVPGSVVTKTGEAKVNQFGKYTIDAAVSVKDGLIAGVDVSARDFISETHRPTNEMKIAQVTEALKDTWNGMAPTQENAEQIYKAILKQDGDHEVIDSVSGATYSAKAVRDAVMDAFDLEYQEEVINVPQSVEPGIYEVEIGYYSDVVWHSLVEDYTTTATLTVNADQTMSLDFETKSGTEKEPLYILAFNGVYVDNDRQGELTMEDCTAVMGLSSNDYEDQFFAKGTQVVNHLTFPLLGGLNKIYNTNCRMYVPAMNNLNGEMSGIQFENGTFNADVFAKIYWDGMQKVGEVPMPEPEPQPQQPVLEQGSYLVPVVSLASAAPLEPVQKAFAGAFGQQIRLDVDAQGRMTATIIPQHMVVDMADMGSYHCNVLTVEGAEYPEMKTELVTPTFGDSATQEIQCPAKIVVPMPQANEQGGYVFTITVDFMNSFLGGGLDQPYPTDVTLTLDFDKAEKLQETGKIEDGNYYVNVAMWHGDQDKPSMGDSAFTNNRRALVTVSNGNVVSVQVASNPVAMGSILSAVTQVSVVLSFDESGSPLETVPVKVLSTEKLTTKPAGQVIDYIKTFSFEMPAQYRPETLTKIGYVPVQFVVPGTPMGDAPMDARLKLDWDSAEKTQDTALEGDSTIPTDVVPVKLMDQASGVKLDGRSDQIPSNAKLSVFKPVQGAEYDAATAAMAEEGVKDWELFQINARVGEQFIQPVSGSVVVSIPCTASGLTVYRIETDEEGSFAVQVNGEVKDGYYVFNTRGLGNFAVVGAPSVLDAYRDIPARHWGRPYIEKAVGLDLMKGTSPSAFAPDLAMTRGMFVTVLGNLAGVKNTDSGKTDFTDVDENAWYAPYVAWAVNNGITSGVGGGKFAPEATITRQEMAVFMVSYCKYAGIELEREKTVDFKDADTIDGWARDAVRAVTEAGLLGDTGSGNFSPMASATRAQAATMLVNFVEHYASK